MWMLYCIHFGFVWQAALQADDVLTYYLPEIRAKALYGLLTSLLKLKRYDEALRAYTALFARYFIAGFPHSEKDSMSANSHFYGGLAHMGMSSEVAVSW